MNKDQIKKNKLNCSFRDNEDLVVLDYLDTLDSNRVYSFLEVGSGECRFVKKIQSKYKNIEITCIEVNPQLAKIAKDLGCSVINENLLNVCLSQKFDIVHCSHVIEHFGYPDISKVLDFLVESFKTDGRLIIRSPLLCDVFYTNLDHIKPYPPEAIYSYFHNNQQQKKGNVDIIFEKIWYRTYAKKVNPILENTPFGVISVFGKPINCLIHYCNIFYEKMWKRYRWPATKPDAYVVIIRK